MKENQGWSFWKSTAVMLCLSMFLLQLPACKLLHIFKKTSVPVIETMESCHCANSGKQADTVIVFSNKKSISFCGEKAYHDHISFFKNLSYNECYKQTASNLIPTQGYLLEQHKDSVYLKALLYLPVGPNASYQEVGVMQEKLYFERDSLRTIKSINAQFPVYGKDQILDVFEAYQHADENDSTAVNLLMDKLFVSAVSGNVLAYKTFKNFQAKFKNLSPEALEKYDRLYHLLNEYNAFK